VKQASFEEQKVFVSLKQSAGSFYLTNVGDIYKAILLKPVNMSF